MHKKAYSYIILEKPLSTSEISWICSGRYGGVDSGTDSDRIDDHRGGILFILELVPGRPPGALKQDRYEPLAEAVKKHGKDIYMLKVIPELPMTKEAAFVVEHLVICYLKQLPHCLNKYYGSITYSNCPELRTMSVEKKGKLGLALLIHRFRGYQPIHIDPIVKASSTSSKQVESALLRELKKKRT